MKSVEMTGSHTGRDRVPFTEQFKVVDERLHALLHHSTRRWNNFVIIDFDSTRGHLVQALKNSKTSVTLYLEFRDRKTHLADNPQALAHLLHATQIPVVAITLAADGNIKLNFSFGLAFLISHGTPLPLNR